MDALREDVESMRKELEFWRRERKSHARVIAEARRAAEDARGGGGATDAREEAEETEAEIAAMKKRIAPRGARWRETTRRWPSCSPWSSSRRRANDDDERYVCLQRGNL